jgi:hypothetical protein
VRQLSPCHRVEIVGGPARGWCHVCGRSYQLDDPSLILVPSAEVLDLPLARRETVRS